MIGFARALYLAHTLFWSQLSGDGEFRTGRCVVALRFQDGRDEVDRAAKESRATGVTVFLLLVIAVITGAIYWFGGESLASYEKELAFYIGLAFVIWLAAPYYHEFRIRTKEINGKVSAIEEALNASAKRQSKLMHRLTAIERALNVRTDDREKNPDIQEEEADENENVDAATREELLAKYRESANRGEVWGQYNLGVTYNNGDRGASDFVQAAFWFRKAADQGHTDSQLFLANLLAGGEGVEPDYPEAARLYQLVSDADDVYSPMAEYYLGEMYASGKGVSRDYVEAARYWKRAAEHGWDLASSELGQLYERGAEGIPQDFSEAYFWFYVSVGNKGDKSVAEYRIVERDQMATRLTPESARQVQERARKWFEDYPAKTPAQ